MKKYLMMGMAAVVFSTAFVSCSSEDGIEQKTQIQLNKENYELAFVRNFGTPSPTHTWGFGAKTRTADVNSNEWASKGYVIPKAITDREREVVMDWFATNQNPTSEEVDLHNYFVQNVGHSGDTYTSTEDMNGYTHDSEGSAHMDWIFCGPGYYMNYGMTEPAPYTWDNGDEHINNFNAYSGQIQHILYTGTDYFGFHDSFQDNGQGSKYSEINRNFVIRFIDVDGEVGCYVGFDYESHGQQGDINPDGFFSDRVIKLIPGDGSGFGGGSEYEDRIMCEDLGSTDDFDFNDVVFDVRYADGGAYVKLRNIGGTLSLTVGGEEVHEWCGASADAETGLYPMLGGVNPEEIFVSGANAPYDIDIVVDGTALNTLKGYNNNKTVTENNAEANIWTLEAEVGKVPQKICVSPTTAWPSERQRIDEKYENFRDYVENETPLN